MDDGLRRLLADSRISFLRPRLASLQRDGRYLAIIGVISSNKTENATFSAEQGGETFYCIVISAVRRKQTHQQ